MELVDALWAQLEDAERKAPAAPRRGADAPRASGKPRAGAAERIVGSEAAHEPERRLPPGSAGAYASSTIWPISVTPYTGTVVREIGGWQWASESA